MSKKLETEDKLDIVLSRSDSLRKIGSQYDVHHSTIEDVFNESRDVLLKHWEEKSNQVGRPKNQFEVCPEKAILEVEVEELKKSLAIKSMKLDYSNLQLKWADERSESKNKKNKHLKKKKRKS